MLIGDELCRTELTPHMSDWDLLDKGFSYDVVAVFGSQSTGKSKLSVYILRRPLVQPVEPEVKWGLRIEE